jgi:hypothetical protein
VTFRLISSFPKRINGNVPTQGVQTNRSLTIKVYTKEILDSGTGTISGITTVENIPCSRRVRLYDKHSGRLIREMFSNSVGEYKFERINANLEYFVVAHDHLRIYNGVISDMLTP